jgi:hypothetical protein
LGGISDKDTVAPVEAHKAFVDEVHVGAVTAPADSDGTVLLNLIKYDASASGTVTLVSSYDLEGLTAGKTERVPLVASLTDQQRTLDYGDFLYITTVNNSAALNTAISGGAITVLCKMII